jgi:c-di-GMP-binding flagellar brake protein YcgR
MTFKNHVDASSSSSPADLRYFPRWQVHNRVVYRLQGESILHEGRSHDLSCAGVSMVGHFPLFKQQKLKLRIYLFEDKSIEADGQPVWVREIDEGYLAGIAFCNMSTKIQNEILQYAFEVKKNDVVNHWFEGWKQK